MVHDCLSDRIIQVAFIILVFRGKISLMLLALLRGAAVALTVYYLSFLFAFKIFFTGIIMVKPCGMMKLS